MKGIIKNLQHKISPTCNDADGNNTPYTIFRIFAALLFFFHGAQKIFGLLGGAGGSGMPVPFGGLTWWAGLIEIVVGLAVFLGIFTRLAAFLAVIEMLVAYFMVHFPKNIFPLLNGGELALMYLFSFLVIFWYGAGRMSLEKFLFKKEIF